MAPALPSTPSPSRLVRVFDDEVYPLVGQRLAEMLLRTATVPARAMVLEVGCATGALTAELAHRVDGDSRIVATDPSQALLDLARVRVHDQEHVGRRVFFRAHGLGAKLPFAEETFDLIIANLPFGELPDPAAVLADYFRVAKRGAQVVIATLLRGTWSKPLDLLREVLVRHGRKEALAKLDVYRANEPPAPETVALHMEGAGWKPVDAELQGWELVFRSGREFFYAPVIEFGPLARWKDLVGSGSEMQETFLQVKEAIDTYFAGRAFPVSMFGGRFSARKPRG